ncbi:Alpha/Beta hydrolase protein [Xylogone sp. PMI_703]|nr:Alpha/Beta hydrolase protein [Xylogone sp. PMI_703]
MSSHSQQTLNTPRRSQSPKLAGREKVDIVMAIIEIVISGALGLFTALFRGSAGAPSYLTHVIHHLLRKTSRLSVAQFQYLDRHTSTDLVYSQFVARIGLPKDSITLPNGTNCHWIGSKESKRVLLYFPGSYVLPASRFHLQFATFCAKVLDNTGRDAAVMIVSTGLAPAYQYPQQLRQGVTALKYLFEETGRRPSDITLVGDSAGGNLVLALMSHITHPVSDVPHLELQDELQGSILISPITDFDATTPSTKLNAKKDWIDQSSITTWGTNYVGHGERSVYINPARAAEEWWKDVRVKQVIVLYGEYELQKDSIETWATRFKKYNPETKVILGQGEFHAQPVMDFIRGSKVWSKQTRALETWLTESLWL